MQTVLIIWLVLYYYDRQQKRNDSRFSRLPYCKKNSFTLEFQSFSNPCRYKNNPILSVC